MAFSPEHGRPEVSWQAIGHRQSKFEKSGAFEGIIEQMSVLVRFRKVRSCFDKLSDSCLSKGQQGRT
jgi:hypothetical protein